MAGTSAPESMCILLIDDDEDVRTSVGNYLTTRGYCLFEAENGKQGVDLLRCEQIDIVITDVKMPGMDGFAVLKEARQLSPETEVIMVTGYGDMDIAVQAMREGAFDFFTKPVKMRELRAALERTVRFHALRRDRDRAHDRLRRLGAEARKLHGLGSIIGGSPGIQQVRDQITQVCEAGDITVLISGETGTGKEVVARAVHYESARSERPFVAVDCTAVPQTLLEVAFYGHEKGAFTDARETREGYFEQAQGGTLFLDEIGDMDPEMQSGLLRTLETRRIRRVGGADEIPVDVRVVSATNRDLPDAIGNGRFREDLYYRLNAFTVHLPPLRERIEDIAPLAEHFLDEAVHKLHKPVEGFTQAAITRLEDHVYPGNVRELKNTVEHAVILCQDRRIAPNDLEFAPSAGPAGPLARGGRRSRALNLDSALARVPDGDLELAAMEEGAIREALRRSGGSQNQAAALLGLSRFALRRRLAQYEIESNGSVEEGGD